MYQADRVTERTVTRQFVARAGPCRTRQHTGLLRDSNRLRRYNCIYSIVLHAYSRVGFLFRNLKWYGTCVNRSWFMNMRGLPRDLTNTCFMCSLTAQDSGLRNIDVGNRHQCGEWRLRRRNRHMTGMQILATQYMSILPFIFDLPQNINF